MEEMILERQIEDENGIQITDNDGNPVIEKISTYICPICEEENTNKENEDIKKEYVNNNIEDNQRENPFKNSDLTHIQTAFNNIPFFNKYYKKFKDITHSSDNLIYSGMQFIISLGLQNSYVSSEMGKVRPNIAVMGIMPSGYSKTPMLNNIREVLKFWSFNNINYIKGFEEFTPEGLKSYINKNADKNKLYKMTILRDEVSTLAKSTKNGIMSTSGLEFLSNVYDGRINQHDTRTSGQETFPDEIYCPMWMTGTPTFWSHITNDWWIQGIAFRILYPLTGDMDTRGIKLQNSNISLEEIKPFIDSLTTITRFEPDNDFEQLYLQKTHEIREIQNKAISEGKSEDIEYLYYKKYPELILKFAMIHRASMMEKSVEKTIEDALIGTKDTIYTYNLTKDDFEWAEQDFEMYKEGFIQAYDSYVNAQKERYKQTDTSFFENKFMQKLKKLKDKKQTYKIGKHNEIIKDEKGEWVKLSEITNYTHFNGQDNKIVIESLIGQEKIEKITCTSGTRKADMIKLI